MDLTEWELVSNDMLSLSSSELCFACGRLAKYAEVNFQAPFCSVVCLNWTDNIYRLQDFSSAHADRDHHGFTL